MKQGDKFFVRIDKKEKEEALSKELYDIHLKYIKDLAKKAELYGGGFKDIQGGMILFKANDFDEADNICKNDPIILEGYYSYQLFEWDILVTSPE